MVAPITIRTKDRSENFDEKNENLEEDDLSIMITNNSQRIFSLIKNENIFRFSMRYVINPNQPQKSFIIKVKMR